MKRKKSDNKMFFFSQKRDIYCCFMLKGKSSISEKRRPKGCIYAKKTNVYKSGVGAKNKTWYTC